MGIEYKCEIGFDNALPNMHSLKKFNTNSAIWSLDTYGDIWSELTINGLALLNEAWPFLLRSSGWHVGCLFPERAVQQW